MFSGRNTGWEVMERIFWMQFFWKVLNWLSKLLFEKNKTLFRDLLATAKRFSPTRYRFSLQIRAFDFSHSLRSNAIIFRHFLKSE